MPEAADNKSYTYNAAQLDTEDVQLESDPVCSSAGCVSNQKFSHPVDYKVANFGKDHNINQSDESLAWAEKQLNHKWIPAEKPKPTDPILYDD